MTELESARGQMNEINGRMLRLFRERMELSARIAEIKRESGLPVRDEARERDILENAAAQSGELSPYAVRFFETLMALSREYQETL